MCASERSARSGAEPIILFFLYFTPVFFFLFHSSSIFFYFSLQGFSHLRSCPEAFEWVWWFGDGLSGAVVRFCFRWVGVVWWGVGGRGCMCVAMFNRH